MTLLCYSAVITIKSSSSSLYNDRDQCHCNRMACRLGMQTYYRLNTNNHLSKTSSSTIQQQLNRRRPSIPSLIFLRPLSLRTCLATSLFSMYLKNLYMCVLWITARFDERGNNFEIISLKTVTKLLLINN